MRVVHWTLLVTTTFWDCLSPLHHQGAAHLAEAAGRTRLDCVFTCWVIRAGEEDAKAAAALYHLASFAVRRINCADGTLRAGLSFCFLDRIFSHIFTFRIIGAGDEAAVASFTFDEFTILAVGTHLADFLGRRYFAAVLFARAETIGEFFAAHKAAGF